MDIISWPDLTRSPERTVMAVRRPSTWGCNVAERRDLMGATESLLWGTGASETATFCTGMARIPPPAAAAAGGAAFFWQPQTASPKTIQVCPIKRFKTITLTCCIRCAASPGSGRRVGFDERIAGTILQCARWLWL